jgi:hypothetical protein
MSKIQLQDELLQDIADFCELNNIESPNEFATKLLKDAFLREKWAVNKNFKPIEVKKEVEPEKVEKPVETKRNFPSVGDENDLYNE